MSQLTRAASSNRRSAREQRERATWYRVRGHRGVAEDLERNARELLEAARRQEEAATKQRAG